MKNQNWKIIKPIKVNSLQLKYRIVIVPVSNKEPADLSAYYFTAIAMLDRQIGPDQFTPEKYNDPNVRELIDKVVLK